MILELHDFMLNFMNKRDNRGPMPQWRHSNKELFSYFCHVCNTGGKKHNWINASNLLKSTGTAIRWRKNSI